MAMIYTNERDVHARVRRRRRRIACTRNIRLISIMRRLSIIMFICALITFGGYFGVRGEGIGDIRLSSGAFAAEETIYKKVTVYNGDTLWDIASGLVEPSKDVRKLVKEICKLNNITQGKIYPGQTILVPVSAYLA